ncbi:class II aldolase/adducin N-terminal [Aspergillus caelatus]|uniref:Class II aldolase/adducin N-terminal n=1 Tax=Aspergillus caelatus TaxID=61420 RepID=A0A5N7ACU0_9EURO|nr:class II aldolase/adducin N-terminal [Aspergillus caelatus]KAE8366976.1 class II aldolase/adducin N-terminal [Aspergillus caelatus]
MAPMQDDETQQEVETPLQLISQGVCLPDIPKHPTFAAQRKSAHILDSTPCNTPREILEGNYKANPLQNPLAVHFGLLKVSDMILVDYEGVPIGGFLIHSAVHKARPDVMVACHTHSPHGMAWSAFGRPLEMLTQDAAYLYGDAQAVYQDFGGVVLTKDEGDRIGTALGPKGKGMILQNHGLLTVGSTVDEACFLMTLM